MSFILFSSKPSRFNRTPCFLVLFDFKSSSVLKKSRVKKPYQLSPQVKVMHALRNISGTNEKGFEQNLENG